MVTVLLYGHLAKQYGKRHQFEIATPAEAIRALCANYKTFKQAIIQDGQAAYRVLAGKENRSDEQGVNLPVGSTGVVKIVPVVAGSSGLGKIILGAVLIVASIYMPYASWGLTQAGLFATSVVSSVGFSLVLGGISQMLFSAHAPKSSSNEKADNKPGYAFSGAVNTVGQGNPVPYFFGGPLRVGSQVISAGLVTENI
ncbi:MAG: tail assembly protein [Methylotenera sp.]